MRRILSFLFLLTAMLAFSPTSYADTFVLSSDFTVRGGLFTHASGLITIDTVSGLVTGVSMSLVDQSGPGSLGPFSFGPGDEQITQAEHSGLFGSNASYSIDIKDAEGASVDLILPVGTLVGYTGGDICSESDHGPVFSLCRTFSQMSLLPDVLGDTLGSGPALDGTLTPFVPPITPPPVPPPTSPSPIPEPSSLMLLSTGALGLLGMARRRAAFRRTRG